MHKCLKCGKEFEGKFCPSCGTSVDGKPHCPKCGADIQPNAKFCNECGYSLEQKNSSLTDKLSKTGQKVKEFFISAWQWIKQHIALTAFISILLATAIALLCLIPTFTSIFKVKKVSKINIGDTKAQVKEILGEPYAEESKEKEWVYYEDEYIELTTVNDDLSEDDINDMDWEDFENAVEEELEAEEKALEQTYKKVTVKFEQAESEEKNLIVASIWLDTEYSPNILKPSKKTVEELTVLSGEIQRYSTDESFPITYEVEYTDGSYVKAKANASYQDAETPKDAKFWTTHSEGSTIPVKWRNDWCDSLLAELKVSKAESYRTSADGATLYLLNDYYYGSLPKNDKANIINVVLENGVSTLKANFLKEYGNLQTITLPNTLTTIEEKAFDGCASLQSVTVDGENQNYSSQDGILYNKTKTEIIHAPKAISGSVTIPDSVTSFNEGVFANCDDIQNITLPFVGEKLNGTSNTHFGFIFGASTFSYNYAYLPTSLKTVVITGGNSISDKAFYDCDSLTSITIPNSVRNIGSMAFCSCESLHTINIPANVTSIGEYAFESCTSLQSITVADNNTSYASQDGVLYNKAKTEFVHIPSAIAGNVTVPNSITTIDNYSFSGCSSLTSITIPNSVTSIDNSAFFDCSGLQSITVDGSNANYASQDGILYNKAKTSIVYIPLAVGGSVTIPSGVTYISSGAFSNRDNLEGIAVESGNAKYHSAGNCIIRTADSTLISGCKNSIIPTDGSVTSIGSYAFRGCSSLTSITIPNSVTSIGNSAFSGCSSLQYNEYYNALYLGNSENKYVVLVKAKDTTITSCTINSNTKFICDSAFYNCDSLQNISVPNSVINIGEDAFYNCDSLQSITLPFVGETLNGTSNTHFGFIFGASNNSSNGIYVLTSLKTVVINGGAIANYALNECINLQSVTLGSGVTSIGNYAFYGCSGLTSITIPNSVTSIGNSAFSGCNNLQSITIGSGVTSIAEKAFLSCSNLTDITFTGTKTEWYNITKGSYWNYGTGNYTIHCSDGDIAKS